MRLVDFLLVIPRLPLMIFLALFLKPSFWNVVIILSIFGWTTTARAVRPLVKSLRQTEFVIAAQALGGSDWHVLFRHIVPHLYSIFAVQFVLEARQAILAEAGLGFLGLEDPTTKSWGLMLSHAFNHEATFVTNAWTWTVMPPAILLTFFILALSLIAVGLEGVFNPKLRVEKEKRIAAKEPEQNKKNLAFFAPLREILLTNSWKLFAELQIHDASSADSGFGDDHSGVFDNDFADDFRFFTKLV